MSDPSQYEILVVDDTAANLKLLSALLVEQGYRVRAASSGVVALRSVAFKAPDLILLDVRMPGMDGYEVCRQIKADPQQRMIPVIFVSALNETADKLKGFAVGGVDFVTKPVDPAEVLARVRTHLELRRLQRRQERIQIELAERVEERTEELKQANLALQASEERLRLVIEATSDGIWDGNPETGSMFFSDRWYTLLGYAPNEFPASREAWRERIHPDDLAAFDAAIATHLAGHSAELDLRYRMRTRDGAWKWINSRGRLIERDAAGQPRRLLGTSVDITDRQRAEEALRTSEAFYRSIFDSSLYGIGVIGANLELQQVNAAFCKMMGYTSQQLLGRLGIGDITQPDDWPASRAAFRRLIGGVVDDFMAETRYVTQSGKVIHALACVNAIRHADGSFVACTASILDISEPKRAAAELASALREKETLLKEIYHRVKNNLQVVSSLLTMQGARASDEARALLAESAARVRSIALVHEQLYRSATLSSIRYPAYVRQLVDHLTQTYDPLSRRVPIKVEIDDLNIGVGTAVPLGLVITELISNAYKHAFTGLATGDIRVSLRRLPDGLLRLVVQDSGRGLPPEPAASSSLGLSLVRMLADQLDGRLDISSPSGACFTLTFTPDAQEVTFISHDDNDDARQASAARIAG